MNKLTIDIIKDEFSVVKAENYSQVDVDSEFCFVGNTDEEKSLVIKTCDVPGNATERDDGWRAMRVRGTLDFSLIGIIADISKILAENKIGIFVVSTYNTDYVLVKRENFDRTVSALKAAGYEVIL